MAYDLSLLVNVCSLIGNPLLRVWWIVSFNQLNKIPFNIAKEKQLCAVRDGLDIFNDLHPLVLQFHSHCLQGRYGQRDMSEAFFLLPGSGRDVTSGFNEFEEKPVGEFQEGWACLAFFDQIDPEDLLIPGDKGG